MAQDRHLTTEQLSAYLDKQLSAQEQAALQAHLQSCQQCQNVLDDLRQTVALLHALPRPALPRSFALPAEDFHEAAPTPIAAARHAGASPVDIRHREQHIQERPRRQQYILRRTLRAMSTIAAVIGFIFLLTAIPVPLHAGGASTSSGTSGGASVPAAAPNARATAQASSTMGTHTAAGQYTGTAPAKGTPNSGPTPTPVPTAPPQNRNAQPAPDILSGIGATLDPTAPGGRALDGLLLLALAIIGFAVASRWRKAKTLS